MTNTLKTLMATAALAITIAPSANAMPIGETTQNPQVAAKWHAYDEAARAAYAKPAPVAADDGGVPLPMAGGVIAIVMLSFGGVAAAAKRRKTVRPAFPSC
jgi:hypothetical protein